MFNRMFISAVAFVALVLPAVVSADAEVYYRIAGDPASNTVGNVLTVNALSAFGSVDIEMRAVITDLSIYSANTTLRNAGSTNATLSNMSIVLPPGNNVQEFLDETNTGDILASNFGGATFDGAGYAIGDQLLATFTLDYDLSNNDTVEVSAEVGNILWAESDFTGADVRFANGPIVDGSIIGAGGDTVITIVPEPTALSLLLLGGVTLVRRRRA